MGLKQFNWKGRRSLEEEGGVQIWGVEREWSVTVIKGEIAVLVPHGNLRATIPPVAHTCCSSISSIEVIRDTLVLLCPVIASLSHSGRRVIPIVVYAH